MNTELCDKYPELIEFIQEIVDKKQYELDSKNMYFTEPSYMSNAAVHAV